MIVFKFIKASAFFPKYAPEVKRYTEKLRGLDGNNKPIEWTREDRSAIKSGLKQMVRDIIKSI